ncbi:MAG: SlyX family protein [Steroidobacteraceae bacterium]
MDSEALEQIQSKIAFLERANTELSDVVFRQQQEIQALAARLKEVSARLQTVQSGGDQGTPEDERPPHY